MVLGGGGDHIYIYICTCTCTYTCTCTCTYTCKCTGHFFRGNHPLHVVKSDNDIPPAVWATGGLEMVPGDGMSGLGERSE